MNIKILPSPVRSLCAPHIPFAVETLKKVFFPHFSQLPRPLFRLSEKKLLSVWRVPPPPLSVSFYPNELLWVVATSKFLIKKNPGRYLI